MRQKTGKQPEILAPCGSEESVHAAVCCGADAVYLGQRAFNARQNADNFDALSLKKIVSYCHLYGVKVYQTLNTLVFDSEIQLLLQCIRTGCQAGVDAFIIQDMGVLSLVRHHAPDMPIHASTQMTIHTPAGAQLLEKLGVKRVVLARELSLKEIEEIRSSAGIELEVFVHGALCVCVSGQCYMSGMLGGRSGNRGCCAQPCRLPFSVRGDGSPDLSLKDLSAIGILDRLAAAGVDSFKIEGRMKRPEYVAASVTACAQKLRGKSPDMDTLRAVFSRSGFTNAYLLDQRGAELFGSRRKEDVTAAAEVLKPLRQFYHKPVQRVACRGTLTVKAGKPVIYCMTDADGNNATACGSLPEPAQQIALTLEKAGGYLSKLGGTPFYLSSLDGSVENGLMVPASELNALRRECVGQLSALREAVPEKRFEASDIKLPRTLLPSENRKGSLRLRVSSVKQLEKLRPQDCEAVIMPLQEALAQKEQLADFPLILELPRVYFGKEALLRQKLQAAKKDGYHHVLVQNPAQILLCKELGFTMSGGFGLNITNSYAAAFYLNAGLADTVVSFETNLEEARRVMHCMPLGAVVYGHLPLMITRSCPLGKYRSCETCGKEGTLTDRQGKRFLVRCHDGVREIYNPDLLYLADRMKDLSCFDYLMLYFTAETPEEAAKVVQEYRQGTGKRDRLTRGLYYRRI